MTYRQVVKDLRVKFPYVACKCLVICLFLSLVYYPRDHVTYRQVVEDFRVKFLASSNQ